MAVVTFNTKAISRLIPQQDRVFDGILGASLDAGVPVFENASGVLVQSDAGAAGTARFDGILLETADAKQGASFLKEGFLEGYDVSGLAVNTLVYVDDNGLLNTTAGTNSVPAAIVKLNANKKKSLYVEARWVV